MSHDRKFENYLVSKGLKDGDNGSLKVAFYLNEKTSDKADRWAQRVATAHTPHANPVRLKGRKVGHDKVPTTNTSGSPSPPKGPPTTSPLDHRKYEYNAEDVSPRSRKPAAVQQPAQTRPRASPLNPGLLATRRAVPRVVPQRTEPLPRALAPHLDAALSRSPVPSEATTPRTEVATPPRVETPEPSSEESLALALERRLFGSRSFSSAQLDAVMWGMSALRCGEPGGATGLESRAGAILRVQNH